ncbi:FMRFamide receptor [Echinococcus granulosus]|uniref:FMRFamide receptor n=1 Tax=Echinococcus granulosus TaxID=6210 RepID=U6JKC0_ECHGR|nr:FMRFamide receptor [Echinococcus granulosus]EUB60477.1 FMRFamide receptor [Echinococcus granulosus]KAH9281029.1 FMRFamide receptor [Echinococcus granulosus]CDS22879.1 somatostatin receptor [Echinococcus granulosus]
MSAHNNSTFSDRGINYAHWLIFGPLSCPIAILGFIGNYLTLQTLHQPQLSCINSSVFLKFLTIADAATIFFYFISFIIPVLASEGVVNWMDNSGYYHAIYPLALTAQTCAVYTVVLFSIVRYVNICHPFGLHALRTRRVTRMMVSCIFVFAVICNLPRVFEHIPISLRVFNASCNCTEVRITRLGEQQLYISIYTSYGYTFGIFVIPVSIVAVLNARLGFLLHHVRREFTEKRDKIPQRISVKIHSGGNHNPAQESDTHTERIEESYRHRNYIPHSEKPSNATKLTYARARVTGRLFCLVSVFIAFQSLPMVDNLMQAFMSDLVKAIFPNYSVFYAICQFSVMLNSSLNTVLYCFLGQRFRRTFAKMVYRWLDGCYSFLALVSCPACPSSR